MTVRDTMGKKWVAIVVMPLLMAVLLGCPKKKPKTEPSGIDVVSEPIPEPATTEMPAPEPPPVRDVTEEELPSDLAELNRVIFERGYIGDVFFALDESTLGDEARDRLAANGSWMREHPEILFTIEGHCDERGTNEYNLALGNRRANTAKDYLASLGIDGSRLRTISYGEERPFCTQSDESCWAENRRAHFVATARR